MPIDIVKALRIMAVVSACVLVLQDQKGENFKRPLLKTTNSGRVVPNSAWITTNFDDEDDVPYQKIANEYKQYEVYKRDGKPGSLAAKARAAHASWRVDCQDPIKLYRACAALGAARSNDTDFDYSSEALEIWSELGFGYHILKNPPRSYLFVRMGYRMTAGNGWRLKYGKLVNVLIGRRHTDRSVIYAGIREAHWEQGGFGEPPQAEKGVPLLNLLEKETEALRNTKYWRPWDDFMFASIYEVRYGVSNFARKPDKRLLQKAIDFNERAIKAAPKELNKKFLLDFREELRKKLEAAGRKPTSG